MEAVYKDGVGALVRLTGILSKKPSERKLNVVVCQHFADRSGKCTNIGRKSLFAILTGSEKILGTFSAEYYQAICLNAPLDERRTLWVPVKAVHKLNSKQLRIFGVADFVKKVEYGGHLPGPDEIPSPLMKVL